MCHAYIIIAPSLSTRIYILLYIYYTLCIYCIYIYICYGPYQNSVSINTARAVLILTEGPVSIDADRAVLMLTGKPVSINTDRFARAVLILPTFSL